ncbi:myosin-10-like [Tripterygium wilfordii]|uniref:Myosin-10-like n=1 Tax=Tripterygium wilfordii TaxID=458696 RepID=A0A7J7CJI4_TRIWF|nr:COP1-interactive protein 1-like [Tripterygium wilfordii]KAF5734204.1 myosin-10-like [Tripterygium wilfordii]
MIKQPEIIGSIASHADVEAQIKDSTEMEKKVSKILKLIKSKDRPKKGGASKDSKKSELIGLVEDFHEQYQLLYGLYDHFRVTSVKKARGRKGKEISTSSTSSSDSDYYSSEDIDIINSNLENERKKAANKVKKDFETANFAMAELNHKVASTSEDVEALKSEYTAALRKIKELETINQHLGNEAEEREKELSAFGKELEGQSPPGLKSELKSLHCEKKNLEAQVESKTAEAKQLGEKNAELTAKILELELIKKEKSEISAMLKKTEDNENNLTYENEALVAEVSNLKLELDSLRAQKCELEEHIGSKRTEVVQDNGLAHKVSALQQELHSLHRQKNELSAQLERKTKDIFENLIQVETLEEDPARNTVAEEKILEEKDGIPKVGQDLELDVDSPHNLKNELEQQLRSKVHEIDQLRKEKEKLHDRIFELEEMLTDRGKEFFSLQKQSECKENEASTQIMTLTAQVNNLKQEMGSLQALKSELEMQNERLIQDFSQSQTLMENENTKLTSKIADQQNILKEREDTIKKLTEDYKQVKRLLVESKSRLQFAERKMEELAEEFRKKMEDHIRLLYQRIVVAEQIHTENKLNYRKAKERLEQENKLLEEKIAAYEPELYKMWDILKPGNNALTTLDLVFRRFHHDNGSILERISRISNEIQSAKNWVAGTNNEMKRLKHNMDGLTSQLDGKEEQELMLREKVWNLEAKLGKEGGEKLVKESSQLERKVRELESKIKEQDEKLLGIGEEKREAIRQLCILIDYHRNRCDYLKEVISKMNVRCRRAT